MESQIKELYNRYKKGTSLHSKSYDEFMEDCIAVGIEKIKVIINGLEDNRFKSRWCLN